MRDAINSNPMVQAAVVGVLLLGAVFFFVSSSGGKEEEEAAAPESSVSLSGGELGVPEGEAAAASEASVAGALAAAGAPPLPKPVVDAYRANSTIVLLIVRDGGIDDRIVRNAGAGLAGFRD